jgi:calcineurin-like phosphoesterase family protein
MGAVYFTSDLHDGHRAIGKYRNPITPIVTDIESNREFILSKWRARKQDKVFLLGDIFFAKDSHEFIKSLLGTKDLILGNHELETQSRSSLLEINEAVNHIYGLTKGKWINQKFWLSHAPLHPSELRGKKNIHGHIHHKDQDFMNLYSDNYDSRYINVNMDVLLPRTGEIMLTAEELIEYSKGF